MPKELWTAEQAASFLGITKRGLYQRVYRGTIPYIKLGSGSGTIRFDPEEMEAFINGHRVQAFAQNK